MRPHCAIAIFCDTMPTVALTITNKKGARKCIKPLLWTERERRF